MLVGRVGVEPTNRELPVRVPFRHRPILGGVIHSTADSVLSWLYAAQPYRVLNRCLPTVRISDCQLNRVPVSLGRVSTGMPQQQGLQNQPAIMVDICLEGANRLLTRSAAQESPWCSLALSASPHISRFHGYLPTKSVSFTPRASAIATINVREQFLSPRSIKNNRAGVIPTACDSCHCVQPFFCLTRRIFCPVVTRAHPYLESAI